MDRTVRYIIFFIVVALVILILLSMIPQAQQTLGQARTVIVIDAGHGGFDGGATGRLTGVHEDTLNLAVAKKLQMLCRDIGHDVIMTRGDDEALGDTKHEDMAARRGVIEASCADVVVSIHMNKFGDSGVSGPQVFYHKESAEGEKLAGLIQQKLNTRLSPPRPRTHKPETYFILRAGTAPCVIVECGFLSNEREEKLLQTEEYQQQCAEAIFSGLLHFINQRFLTDIHEEIGQ